MGLLSRFQVPVSSSRGALGALLVVVALVACGCAPADPSLHFLQSQPENDLVYPGATLLSTDTHGPAFPLNSCCSIERKFSSGATATEIGDWYAAQLAQKDWPSPGSPSQNGDGSLRYHWQKPALDLLLEFMPASGGVVSYSVSLLSPSGLYQFAAACETLRSIPETDLAPPAANHASGESFTILPQGTGASLTVVQHYVLDSPASVVLAYYDSNLRAQGWTSKAVAPGDFAGSSPTTCVTTSPRV